MIYDYRPAVNPLRLQQLRQKPRPAEFGLGGENHRSPNAGVLLVADHILQNQAPLPATNDVKIINYRGHDFDAMFHAAVGWLFGELRNQGIEHPTLAVLCRSNSFVAALSEILQAPHTIRGQALGPVEHGVVWDAELSIAAAVVVASIMEWRSGDLTTLANTQKLIGRYYEMKNAERPTNAGASAAAKYAEMAAATLAGRDLRTIAFRQMKQSFSDGFSLIGDPIRDWLTARRLLGSLRNVGDIFNDANMVRLFGAREAIISGLSDLWLESGSYRDATGQITTILNRQRLLETERTPRGCMLMTFHKSKGKEFDGVVLVEGAHRSPFFDTGREQPPFERSRRLFRVGLTRARHLATVIRHVGSPPLVG